MIDNYLAPLNSLQIWNNPIDDMMSAMRRGKTRIWTDSMDNQEAYNKNITKAENKDQVTYSPTDVSYTYNSHGYRSDEFDKSDINFLFAGCSFTEGEGLPLDVVWSKQLQRMFAQEFDIGQGYYSVARGGLSASAIARRVYGAFTTLNLRPKVVFILFPSIYRTEMYSKNFSDWISPFDYVPSYFPPLDTSEERYMFDAYEGHLRVSNVINEFYKNCLFVDMLCQTYGATFKFATWQGHAYLSELASKNIDGLPDEYLFGERKKSINLTKLITDFMPTTLKDKYLNTIFKNDHLITERKYPQTVARDFAHPGPNPQWQFAKEMYDFAYPAIKSIYENN